MKKQLGSSSVNYDVVFNQQTKRLDIDTDVFLWYVKLHN